MPLSSRAVRIISKLGPPSAFTLTHRATSQSYVLTASKMAFDKVKILRTAEKYLELGKIPAAIKEYSQVVQQEPDDFTTLNTLGDLYARVGNQTAAVSCFHRIAHHYREQGFSLKSIADRKSTRLNSSHSQISYAVF